MADASKLKSKRSRSSLGSPPGPDEVATSLSSPEIAPAVNSNDKSNVLSNESLDHLGYASKDEGYIRKDGRSARKTNRTLAFATRVTPLFDREIREIADREGIKLVEVLENSLEAYKLSQGYQ